MATSLRISLPLATVLVLSACGDSRAPGSMSGLPGTGSTPTTPITPPPVATPPVTSKGCVSQRSFAAASVEREALTHFGRRVTPLGKLTDVGNFPGGGKLTPDGRFYWAVDTGRDVNYIWIVDALNGGVVQKLPLPGGGGHAVFAPDGRTAYVPGEPDGGRAFPDGTPARKAEAGDALHVYSVDTATGLATEGEPISLPSSANPTMGVGSSRNNNSVVAGGGTAYEISEWPEDIAISPDGKTLLVALLNSDRAALVDTASKAVTVLTVGHYPRGAAIERGGRFGYISNSNDGTLSKIDLASHAVTATIAMGLGGEDIGDAESGLIAVVADPKADRVYAAAANRDLVLAVDTLSDAVSQRIDLRRYQGAGGIGATPVGLEVTPDGCSLLIANAYDNAVLSVALQDRVDGGAKAFELVGAIPVGDYPTGVAVSSDGSRLVWLAGKGLGVNKGQGLGAAGVAPRVNKQFWQNGIVGTLALPDDASFRQMAAVVASNLVADAVPTPAATVVHGAQSGPFAFAPSAQIKYVFLVVKENRTYDNILASIPRGEGQPSYQLYEDNCGAANTAFEGGDRNHPGCGTTPNAHALVRRWPLLTQFMANSEQSQEGHIFSTGGYLTDYVQRTSHWNPSNRGRPYDIGLYPITYPPKYYLFDQLTRAGIAWRNYGEKSGGLNPETASQGANRSTTEFAQGQTNTNQSYPFNGLAGCLSTATPLDPAPLFAGCIFDSGMRSMNRLTGANVPPAAGINRFDIFEKEFTALMGSGQTPSFTYLIQFADHGQGNTPNNTTEPAQAADNDLALGQLVDFLSHSSIWPQTAIFVMEDDSQDGADHVDSHRMPAYVISPWVKQGTTAATSPIISRRYDQLSMLRTIQLILGVPVPSLQHAIAVPMYDLFIAPTATPDVTPYTAILPERSLLEQNGATAASIAFAKNAPELYALSQVLPWQRTDVIPQGLADRIHYANVWGDDRHYPGPGPNGSASEKAREAALWAEFRSTGHVRSLRDTVIDEDD